VRRSWNTAGAQECTETYAYQRCDDGDGDGCLEWSEELDCVTPTPTCYGGYCTCDECHTAGDFCVSSSSIRTCSLVSGCLRWGPSYVCPSGSCFDNHCE
jgi:hypothetical protein